ncbi:hypothetical protein HNY73_003401 [Argiope bruennichi]|uniref:Uncharacterized protein n=1 Tax=Argiope bruennichi TaxID=94029 RepID=A0A8T0FPZ7_ARGBR|nr:hypothetical protein HNY73_003401 [Argiope bruennichi]
MAVGRWLTHVGRRLLAGSRRTARGRTVVSRGLFRLLRLLRSRTPGSRGRGSHFCGRTDSLRGPAVAMRPRWLRLNPSEVGGSRGVDRSPTRPVLKHGPRSLTCVRVNGSRLSPEAQ